MKYNTERIGRGLNGWLKTTYLLLQIGFQLETLTRTLTMKGVVIFFAIFSIACGSFIDPEQVHIALTGVEGEMSFQWVIDINLIPDNHEWTA